MNMIQNKYILKYWKNKAQEDFELTHLSKINKY